MIANLAGLKPSGAEQLITPPRGSPRRRPLPRVRERSRAATVPDRHWGQGTSTTGAEDLSSTGMIAMLPAGSLSDLSATKGFAERLLAAARRVVPYGKSGVKVGAGVLGAGLR